jgi:hypothetical protein
MPRWAWAGVIWLLGACAPASLGVVDTATAAADVEAVDPRTRVLRLYDEAGFPDVGGQRLVERRIHSTRGVPSCTRGVLLRRGQANVFLSADLSIDYGTMSIDAIPQAMRRSTPREPLFQSVPKREARTEHVVDAPIPESLLAQPGLGLGLGAEGTVQTCNAPAVSPDLDILVRSRWAEMRGRPDLMDVNLVEQLAGAELQEALRTELAAMLYQQAVDGMRHWLPRMEVAQLLRRAARITPSPQHAGTWLLDANRLEESTRLLPGRDPAAIATLLAEQSMHPLSEHDVDLSGPTWDATRYLRDPIGELIELGMPGAQQLVAHVHDERWTRALCDVRPCTVGELVQEGLVTFAGRGFANAAEVEAWWAEVGAAKKDDPEHARARQLLARITSAGARRGASGSPPASHRGG